MDERHRKIQEYLEQEDVQQRIQQDIDRGRQEATVTIGRAASLFGFTENQLRDWEDRKLLQPIRHTGGQRQYPPSELEKLAIIRALLNARYTPGDIPPTVGDIWKSVSLLHEQRTQAFGINGNEAKCIDERVEHADQRLFWRNFVPRVLRLTLILLREYLNMPDSIAGLVLPLHWWNTSAAIPATKDLPNVGESLIGWLAANESFATFLDPAPKFEYDSDFQILPLQTETEWVREDNTLIVVQRKPKPAPLPAEVVKTIRLLLRPLYEDVQQWKSYFGSGMRDSLDAAPDFDSGTSLPDTVLNGLADMIVRLGGKTVKGKDHWRFCSILLPNDPHLPLQQRSLVVRAQNEGGPHKVGLTKVYPHEAVISVSLRAFQGGHVIYRPHIAEEDPTIAHRKEEGEIKSAIAIPVGGENGLSLAVLYVASDFPDAFPEQDQRALRIMGRIIEELLLTYRARQQVTKKLRKLMEAPNVVDPTFGDFLSENDFVKELEELLADKILLKEKSDIEDDRKVDPDEDEEAVSFIAIDIDNHSRLATQYGDQMTRNLSREVGLRFQDRFHASARKPEECRLYHVYADRFYLMRKNTSLAQARADAIRLRETLASPPYRIDSQRVSIDQPTPPAARIPINVTVRIAVTSYRYTKLAQILKRYHDKENAEVEVRVVISQTLDDALKLGMDAGGNVVYYWDHKRSTFVRFPEVEPGSEEFARSKTLVSAEYGR